MNMKVDELKKMYCPWANMGCLGEQCMACAISEQIPEDIDGEPVMICLRAEDIRMRLRRG